MNVAIKSLSLSIFLLAICIANIVSAADKMKIVYHVSEAEKVGFVLGNIRNHINGVEDAEKLDIVLVVHGPAGKAFHKTKAKAKVKQRIEMLRLDNVRFNMCGNTMKAQKVELKDILDGFSRRDEGGVVRIAELQSKGYIYIRT